MSANQALMQRDLGVLVGQSARRCSVGTPPRIRPSLQRHRALSSDKVVGSGE